PHPPGRLGGGAPAPGKGYATGVPPAHILKPPPRHMGRSSYAARRHIDLARIDLGVGDEFRDRLGRDCWIYRHDQWGASDAGDRRDVADKIEIELVIERRVDRARRADYEQRVAVRECPQHHFGAYV